MQTAKEMCMAGLTASSNQLLPMTRRLQSLLSGELILERCLIWREDTLCKVLLLGRRCDDHPRRSGGQDHWCADKPLYAGYSAISSPTTSRKDDALTRQIFALAFASALAELAQNSGLGLKICRWSTGFPLLVRSTAKRAQ
jgi:hypothetical protein